MTTPVTTTEPTKQNYDFRIKAREEAAAVYAKHIKSINNEDEDEQHMSDSTSSLFQMLGHSRSGTDNNEESQDMFAIDF